MENQITSLDVNEGRKVVPYDKDRKTITFYDTFVDMNGDVVKYDDIAVVQSAALNSSSMIYFYFSNSFTYNFCFTTYDGVKHNFKRHGYQAYGIGNYRRIKKEFDVATFAKKAGMSYGSVLGILHEFLTGLYSKMELDGAYPSEVFR